MNCNGKPVPTLPHCKVVLFQLRYLHNPKSYKSGSFLYVLDRDFGVCSHVFGEFVQAISGMMLHIRNCRFLTVVIYLYPICLSYEAHIEVMEG